MRIDFSKHALEVMTERNLIREVIAEVVKTPDQVILVSDDEKVCQSKVHLDGRIYLLRVFVSTKSGHSKVITVYKTSKIEKYWR